LRICALIASSASAALISCDSRATAAAGVAAARRRPTGRWSRTRSRSWNLDSTGWWYDLLVTGDAEPAFLRRLAGRVGRPITR
jgi:phospholipase C